MHLIYIDDSRDEQLCVFSALAIPSDTWTEAFGLVKDFRRGLRQADGIYIYKELHAWKLVSGRGCIADHTVPKARRCVIFREALALTAALPGAKLFNAVFPKGLDKTAFEWLLNRVNRTMRAWDSRAILICDEGSEHEYTRLARKMHVYNPIPSQLGGWVDTGTSSKNIPIERILEDPFFKRSDQSYLLQLADLCAYALLRREHQLPSKNAYGLHQAFAELGPALVREASSRDPEGIIRFYGYPAIAGRGGRGDRIETVVLGKAGNGHGGLSGDHSRGVRRDTVGMRGIPAPSGGAPLRGDLRRDVLHGHPHQRVRQPVGRGC